jgi:hypothetical protein
MRETVLRSTVLTLAVPLSLGEEHPFTPVNTAVSSPKERRSLEGREEILGAVME